MDPDRSPIYSHVADLLPSRGSVPSTHTGRVFFFSIKFVEGATQDFLLARGYAPDTRQVYDLVVKDLVFFVAYPGGARCGGPRATRVFESRLFNAELKVFEWFTVKVYAKRSTARAAVDLANRTQSSRDCAYVFDDSSPYSNESGPAEALVNGVLCGTLYSVDPRALATNSLAPSDLHLCPALNDAFVMELDRHLPFFHRDAAFDIECVMSERHLDPATQCEPFFAHHFAAYRGMFARYERLSARREKVELERPQQDSIAMRSQRITSISLVIGNRHLHKPRRKRQMVFYDASFPRAPLDVEAYRARAAELAVDIDRVEFVAMPGERAMLDRFLRVLVTCVDTLYVYHARFDVTVLQQRIAYYSWTGGHRGCCAAHDEARGDGGMTLQELWENFLSKQPDVYRGRLTLGSELLIARYNAYLDKVACVLASPALDKDARANEVARARQLYLEQRSKVQTLKVDCYGSDLVDLFMVTNQPRFDSAKNGKLDNKAHCIISQARPGKHPAKMRKVGDISYDKLDEGYLAGGRRLAECLVYNLVDSLLLMRIARYMPVIAPYIFRQISTFNTDQRVHTRGQMRFCSPVGSHKSVEMSRLKTRLDLGMVRATHPRIRDSYYTAESGVRMGGYVMNPLVGLTYSAPNMPLECIVDFASLYPSIMCDLNISSETIVDHGREALVPDYVVYDWATLPGRPMDKYTLVLRVDRGEFGDGPPRMARHFSDTSASLERYLSMRAHHRAQAKKAGNETERAYHERLQQEMKVCANSHYGVSEHTCAAMITNQGQHKLKLVNQQLVARGAFPNYGDTDSTMFWAPDVDEPPPRFERGALRAFSVEAVDYIRRRTRATARHVDAFLRHVEVILVDDMLKRMALIDSTGGKHPALQDAASGQWYVTDPVSGSRLDVGAAFRQRLLCKLEYETCSSVTCHVAKKMYVCLTHELSFDTKEIIKTEVKRRGMVGFKSSRFGATETVTDDFLNVIFSGHAVVRRNRIDRYETRPWSQVRVDDVVMAVRSGRVQFEQIVERLEEKLPNGMAAAWFGTSDGEGELRLLQRGVSLTHLFDAEDGRGRELCFLELCRYRASSVAMGVLPWEHTVRYTTRASLKPEFVTKKQGYGLLVNKESKISYVTLLERKTDLWRVLGHRLAPTAFPPQWAKQDPAVAYLRRFPVDMNVGTLMREYFGAGFACEAPTFQVPAVEMRGGKEDDEGECSQLHVKTFIDAHYFNTNSKCLVHVLYDLHGPRGSTFKGTRAQLQALVEGCVNRVLEVKRELHELAENSSRVFYALYRNLPGELMGYSPAGSDPFAYDPRQDHGLSDAVPKLGLTREYAQLMWDEAVSELRDSLPALSGLVSFVGTDVPYTCRTMTLLLPNVAEAVGVAPQVVLETDTTEDRVLLRLAQRLYYATLAEHVLRGGAGLRKHPSPCHQLRAPPKHSTPEELLRFFEAGCAYLRDGGAVSHCGTCLHFWVHNDPATVIARAFRYEPAHKRFVLLKSLQCPGDL